MPSPPSPPPPPPFSSPSCFSSLIFSDHLLNSDMDSSDYPTDKPPRKELQGPRPAPLKVRKDSHKIKKPPLAPQNQQSHHQQQPPQYRPPVIIYTVSPKVIHTNPSEFMTLVQRLTGSSSSSSSSFSSSSSSTSYAYYSNNTTTYDNISSGGGAVSPAARYATLEKANSPQGKGKRQESEDFCIEIGGGGGGGDDHVGVVERRSPLFPGILSPGPGSLQPIQPDFFFSPTPSDPLSLGSFFHDLSPVQHGNKTYMEGSFMNSPSNFFSPNITSPLQSIDLFNNFFNL